MRILVTGGSGFLGSHVADALTEFGHEVTIFDVNESKYIKPEQKMVIGDILDQKLLDEIVFGQDVVYHFAGIADIDECAERPVETVRYNILGTTYLLESCKTTNIKRFVFASSAYVFSNAGYFYRTSKQACESLIENYNELYGLKYTCLRYGSLYGDRSDERNSIFKLIRQALNEGKIVYSGNGEEIREFIHVRDAAYSSVEILDHDFENQHIILSGSEKLTYRQLLEMMNEMLGNSIKLEIMPSTRKAHYKISPYNFSPKLGRKLVNNPHIDLGQGLLLCMAEIYENLHPEKKEELGLLINKNGMSERI